MMSGLLNLPWWGHVVAALALTHVTIAAVTIYLHRHQAHRALDLHPAVAHFFRCWLWLTTGMVTREWAAIHRKHHARCETAEDPHSPQVLGIARVLFQGAELYQAESRNRATIERYGRGTPDDWIERRLYSGHRNLGIALMLAIDLLLFGAAGLTIWAVQMAWIPFFAAGVINGIGHYWGYRNFQPEDASRNIVPFGILIGGEELHNNHHAYSTSARLSSRWFEFDIGWLYIRILEMLHLARVKKVAGRLRIAAAKAHCDAETLQAVITHRYAVLAQYAQSLKAACAEELRRARVGLDGQGYSLGRIGRLVGADPASLSAQERAELGELLSRSRVLETLHTMRAELVAVWSRSTATREQLVRDLEDWCARAEASGIAALQEFSRRLRCYA